MSTGLLSDKRETKIQQQGQQDRSTEEKTASTTTLFRLSLLKHSRNNCTHLWGAWQGFLTRLHLGGWRPEANVSTVSACPEEKRKEGQKQKLTPFFSPVSVSHTTLSPLTPDLEIYNLEPFTTRTSPCNVCRNLQRGERRRRKKR